jgi:transcription antitermination factor NusG
MMKELRDAFSPEVLAELARPVRTYDPRMAQLARGDELKWYVYEVASRDVEKVLVERRFGIYVPECEETTVRRGRKIERRLPLFPGYVFVFMGDTDENWNRIANIRGVIASIGALPWDEIDKIRVLENQHRPIDLTYFEEETVTTGKKRKRRRKRLIARQDEIVRTRAYGWYAFEEAAQTLDGEGRNQALRELIGVSS